MTVVRIRCHIGRTYWTDSVVTLKRSTVDDLSVAVEVPLEQRTDVVLRVRDEAIDRHDRVHEYRAHDSMMVPRQCPGERLPVFGRWVERQRAAAYPPVVVRYGRRRLEGLSMARPRSRRRPVPQPFGFNRAEADNSARAAPTRHAAAPLPAGQLVAL